MEGWVAAIPGVRLTRPGGAQITSPPVVTRGLVIVGSSIDDNQKVDETSGAVHAFDAVTGVLKWTFDPWTACGRLSARRRQCLGAMSVDEARGLVFLPTSSASPDFYGAARPGDGATPIRLWR
uniref:Pyrrolo-quinoline quinone repeat domain-containing protein n=1 Tax=Phenylobacterium glaciei TaxID=2803784 RepID=A0A974P510_9CAUL|nr:hypothetical protein JKL49_02825 [Phenylobacterium glaciei]